jgi:NhaP-type Na+/H+ and K+/H+ antiporter
MRSARGPFKINFDNYAAAQDISSAALLLINFTAASYEVERVRPVASKPSCFQTLGVVLTEARRLFCYGILKITLIEGFLIAP